MLHSAAIYLIVAIWLRLASIGKLAVIFWKVWLCRWFAVIKLGETEIAASYVIRLGDLFQMRLWGVVDEADRRTGDDNEAKWRDAEHGVDSNSGQSKGNPRDLMDPVV